MLRSLSNIVMICSRVVMFATTIKSPHSYGTNANHPTRTLVEAITGNGEFTRALKPVVVTLSLPVPAILDPLG